MLTISSKQDEVVRTIRDKEAKEVLLIGPLGTSKTHIAAITMLSLAKQFQGSHIAIARRHMPELKRSTYLSFKEAASQMGLTYKENKSDMFWDIGDSRIMFIELNPQRDPRMDRIKSTNLTAAFVDEVDTVSENGYNMLFARCGRKNSNGAPDFLLSACNPNLSYIKSRFYDAWREGTLAPGAKVVEFTMEDSFLGREYYDKFIGMPDQWKQRFLHNRWEVVEDLDSLFKYRFFDAAVIGSLEPFVNMPRYIGYDVARSAGGDRSVASLWYGNVLVDICIVKDKDEYMTTDEQALWLIKYMTQNSVLPENTMIDAVGIGVGVVDFMRSRGMRPVEYVSGATPFTPGYDMLRSQVIYEFSRGLEKGIKKIYENCPFRNELISESMAHNHQTKDKVLAVESKEQVKLRTGGLSPDIFDAVVMGTYKAINLDPKQNPNRIGW
jgi:hypothetical protein